MQCGGQNGKAKVGSGAARHWVGAQKTLRAGVGRAGRQASLRAQRPHRLNLGHLPLALFRFTQLKIKFLGREYLTGPTRVSTRRQSRPRPGLTTRHRRDNDIMQRYLTTGQLTECQLRQLMQFSPSAQRRRSRHDVFNADNNVIGKPS